MSTKLTFSLPLGSLFGEMGGRREAGTPLWAPHRDSRTCEAPVLPVGKPALPPWGFSFPATAANTQGSAKSHAAPVNQSHSCTESPNLYFRGHLSICRVPDWPASLMEAGTWLWDILCETHPHLLTARLLPEAMVYLCWKSSCCFPH